MLKLVVAIFGSHRHTKVIKGIIESGANFRILGLIDKNKSFGEKDLVYEVIGDEQTLSEFIIEFRFPQGF